MVTTGVVHGESRSLCDYETNWRVDAGSLKKTVVFESSSEDSPVDAPSSDSVDEAAIPLLLKSEAADSGPCEIKIWFLQKYEIRQIYVRSTARVYEVYYAESWQSDNEYLCTVRCSVAERDEQVLQAIDIEESSGSPENSSPELKKEKLSAEGNTGASQDDWMEVKVLDSSLEYKTNSSAEEKSGSIGRDIQDFCEATAEISDSDPCQSITIRFLSLPNKTCVCIDEVYVFAYPVGPIDSDHQSRDVRGATGSSLMAMLVPTLLQLSKSGMGQIQGQQASSDLQKGNNIETQSRSTESTDVACYQDEKRSDDRYCLQLHRVDGSTTEPAETQLCNQILDGDKADVPLAKNDFPYGHIERVLEQLVSRVGRIEEVCLRFEENMLKPLNSMEMRIQRVEQQLEELVNNSQHTRLPPCTRISAPFSCNSDSSSLHHDGCQHQPCRAPELEKELNSSNLLNASYGISRSVNGPHSLPSFVVTAPDFSSEDDVDGDGLKLPTGSPQGNKNKLLIDDVLAASLSGFLSASTANLSECERTPFISHRTSEIISDEVSPENVQTVPTGVEITADMNAKEKTSRYTQVLTVMASEFTSEENTVEELPDNTELIDESSNAVTTKATKDGCTVVNSDSTNISRDQLVSNQASVPSNVASSVFAEANSKIPDDASPGLADSQNHVSDMSNTCSSMDTSLDDKVDEAADIIRGETIRVSDQREPLTSLLMEKNDDFEQFPGHRTDDSCTTAGTAGSSTEYVASDGPEKEMLGNFCQSSSAPLVDFGIPILDVKFTSCEDSRTQLPLEALLDSAKDLNIEANPPQKNGIDDAYAQESNFIDITAEETGDSLTSNSLFMDLGVYGTPPFSLEYSAPDVSHSTCKQDTVASLI